MKTLFLRPRIDIPFEALMPQEIGEKWVCFPSLGSLYVRQYARKQGFFCDYLDAESFNLSPLQAAQKAAQGSYDVVALSADTYSFWSTVSQAKEIRKALPKAKIVCGGIHPTIYPKETAMLPWFDYAIFGDGEMPFAQLLHSIAEGKKVEAIPGVAAKVDGEVQVGPAPEMTTDLDGLGFPDFSDVPLENYFSSLAKSRPAIPIVTSRGCPFHCTFCDRPNLAGKLRLRSADHVLSELSHLVGLGVTEFSIYDDTFTVNKKHAFSILEQMPKLDKKIGFDVRSRVDTTTEEMLDALKAAGCDRVYLGIESGDQQMQKRIKKNVDLEKARKVFAQVQKRGMKALAYFMLGLPGETMAQAEKTIEYARTLSADYYLIEVFVPMPATESYEEGLATGVIKNDVWQAFAENPSEDFTPPLWIENLSQNELTTLIRKAYKRAYLTPRYIWRSLLKTATWEEFVQKVKGGMSFLRLLK